ncbi:MAG: AraC family transcriptional regulator [Ktedonobacteraceae bacterium]|nr:AraC family transcriptional regulator [Ktedonobacteraceae bacterium]
MSTHEYTRFLHDPTLSDLELLHATYITHSFAPHTHDHYVVAVVERGAKQFDCYKKRHVAPAGSVVFVNPGEVHTGSSATEQGYTYSALYPSTDLFVRATSDVAGRERSIPFFRNRVVYDRELATLLSHSHRIFEGSSSALERESQLLWSLAQVIVRYADDRPVIREITHEHASIHKARHYLDEHYAENISLGELAALVNLSPFHLLRAFRNQVGLPPHTYQTQTRVLQAKRLLRLGISCIDTALTVGFADQSHLSKHFKRIVGVPPGQYLHS